MALTYRPYRLLKADPRSYTSGVGLGQAGDDPNLAFTLREEAAQRERAKLEAQLAQEQMRQSGETGRNADKLVAGNVDQQNELQFRGWDAHQSRLRSLAQQMAEYGFRSKESADSRAQAEKMARLTDELHRGQMQLGQEFARENTDATRDFELEKLGMNQDQAQYMAYLNDGFQSERDERTAKRQKDFFDYQSQRYEAKAEEQYAHQQYMAQLNHVNKLIDSGKGERPPGWDEQMRVWKAAVGSISRRADLSPEAKAKAKKELQGLMSEAFLDVVPVDPGRWAKSMQDQFMQSVIVIDPETGQQIDPASGKKGIVFYNNGKAQVQAKVDSVGQSKIGAKYGGAPTRKDILDRADVLYSEMEDAGRDSEGNQIKKRTYKTRDDAIKRAEIEYGVRDPQDDSRSSQGAPQQVGLDPAIVEAARQARQLPMGQGGESEPWPRQSVEQGVDPQALVDEAAAIDQEQALLVAAGERPSDDVLARMGAALDRGSNRGLNRGLAPAVDESGVFQQQPAKESPRFLERMFGGSGEAYRQGGGMGTAGGGAAYQRTQQGQAPEARPSKPAASDQVQHPKVTSQAEYDRLPSGTIYLDGPTGKLKRKK